MARIDPLPPVEGNPEALAALTVAAQSTASTDPNDPASDGYAERTELHLSDIGGLTIETLGHALP